MRKYYKLQLAKGNANEYTSDCEMCIIGTREPTPAEATRFCQNSLLLLGYDFVSKVSPITYEEAHSSFDMANEDLFPVFC